MTINPFLPVVEKVAPLIARLPMNRALHRAFGREELRIFGTRSEGKANRLDGLRPPSFLDWDDLQLTDRARPIFDVVSADQLAQSDHCPLGS